MSRVHYRTPALRYMDRVKMDFDVYQREYYNNYARRYQGKTTIASFTYFIMQENLVKLHDKSYGGR